MALPPNPPRGPVVLDQFGRPVSTQDLSREVAAPRLGGIRTTWSEPVASRLTPEGLARILRAAADGDAREYLTLAEEMEERELHYASVLRTRKLAIAGLPVVVKSPTDVEEDVALTERVRELAASPGFRHLIFDLADALGKGFSAVEIIWDTTSFPWKPKRYAWRDPKFFRFDRETGQTLRLLDESSPVDGLLLQPFKFVVHVPRLKSGLPIRGGLAFLAATAYVCKSYSLRDWHAFAELFGIPFRVGKYPQFATDEEKRTLLHAVANLGTDAAAIIPESMMIELIQAASGTGGEAVFGGLAKFWDAQISKAVLGQTMTADDGSSLAQAEVHNLVRGDLGTADALDMEEALNEYLVRPFIELNWGKRSLYPRLSLHRKTPRDLQAFAGAIGPLIDRGLKVGASFIRDELGIPDPGKDEEVLQPMSAAAAPALARALGRRTVEIARGADPTDELEEAADALVGDWDNLVEPMVVQIEQLAQEATSKEDFLQKLKELQLNDRALVEALASSRFVARAMGAAKD